MGSFDKKIDRFLEVLIEKNGYVTVIEGLQNTLMIAITGLIIGIIITIAVSMVLLGGIKRIAKVTETLVPFMAVLYILLGVGVIALNAE